MRHFQAFLLFGVVAGAILLPSRRAPEALDLHRVDAAGNESIADPSFARVVEAPREAVTPLAFFEDLALAAAAGGLPGCVAALLASALLAAFAGLWLHGFRGLRRLFVVVAIGAPALLSLLYLSCFFDGRRIVLGPAAADFAPVSLHAQTDRTTGMLSPRDLVLWHARRGFRALNVSDKNRIDGALAAREAARAPELADAITVVVGEEYHGNPHILLVHVGREYDPARIGRAEMLASVRNEGGAAIVAHPWSHRSEPLDTVLALPLDGVELVNEAITGGEEVKQAALRAKRALVGTLDYKFGPHVTALTLLPASAAATAEGIVQAIRERRTSLLYAVPGGAATGVSYHADTLGVREVLALVQSLYETPRMRRASWIAWIALFAILWRLATRVETPPARTLPWRLLFLLGCVLELGLLSLHSWQVRRAIGTVPMLWALLAHAVVAVPLLAATHKLSAAATHK